MRRRSRPVARVPSRASVLAGSSIAASLSRCCSTARSDAGVNAARSSWLRRLRLKIEAMISPNSATANNAATRDAALLIPDAAPAKLTSTAFMTVVVSGATLIDIPNPSTRTGREERDPVAAADSGNGEQCKAGSGNGRTDHQRRLRAVAVDQSARPAREHRHQQNERQQRSAGGRRGVALYLDEIQRHEKKASAECPVEKEGEQIGAGKRARAKQMRRHHRRRPSHFHGDESPPAPGFPTGSKRGSARLTNRRWAIRSAHRQRRPDPSVTRERSGPIEVSLRLGVPAFGNMPQRDRDGDDGQRNVQEENGTPRQVIDQPAADAPGRVQR